ncbi:hypothetical protein J3A83DRAFT_4238896 [Scleroderma citrinum]
MLLFFIQSHICYRPVLAQCVESPLLSLYFHFIPRLEGLPKLTSRRTLGSLFRGCLTSRFSTTPIWFAVFYLILGQVFLSFDSLLPLQLAEVLCIHGYRRNTYPTY